MPEPFLDVRGLGVGYGGGLVLHDLSLSIAEGSSIAVLGRNGVGKSTLLLALAGHIAPRHGEVRWGGVDIAQMRPHRRVRAGIALVPQEREVFPSLTVDEHFTIADRKGAWTRERIYDVFPRLAERRNNLGGQLSGGEQQMLAIGRALMTSPKLLLLDEPLEGLAPIVVRELTERIRRLMAEDGLSVILVEQHLNVALDLAPRAIVLDRSRIEHDGPSDALKRDRALLDRLVGVRRWELEDARAAGAHS
jgi:branched-chain amino acid transport system ATP-binding protein